MIRMTRLVLRSTLAGGVLALTLAAGVPAHAAPKPPAPPKLNMSKPFQALAGPMQRAIEAAKARADVTAAQAGVTTANDALRAARGSARAAAEAQKAAAIAALGATLTAEKTQLDAIYAAIANQDDRMVAGQLAAQLGGLAQDGAIQRRGLGLMLESGKLPAADVGKYHFFAGNLAYDAKDYAAARTSLSAAIAAGYRENDPETLLAEAYMNDNQVAQGLTILMQAIDARKAAGNPAPQNWYRRGLGAAYRGKMLDQTSAFSTALVRDHPNAENWAGAITILREIARYTNQETLDLMRLMDRTKSYAEERDYVEYIQAADARRLPGEVMNVINAGVAAGKLREGDMFVAEARTIASGRLAADKASLPALERDSRAANATAATASAGGDAFLSYGEAAKAAELYTIALGKPGVDSARVLTRLGIAQADMGRFAEAKASFAKIDGPRKPLAQLWDIYVTQKAAAPVAAAQ